MTVYSLMNKLHDKKIKLWEENGQLKFKAPKDALNDELRQQLVSNKSELVLFLQQASSTNNVPSITPIDREGRCDFPLSFAQERLWFMSQLDPDTASYTIPVATTIYGELDIVLVERAFNMIIKRHENLRTIFPCQQGKAVQRVLADFEMSFEVIDLTNYQSEELIHQKVREICRTEANTPFNLETGPLIRAKMMKVGLKETVFMLHMHHIISDGWSIGVLLREFDLIMQSLSKGEVLNLPPLAIQYVDYSVWQREWLQQGGVLEQQLEYWQKKLSGSAETLELLTDYPRPKVQSFAGDTESFLLDSELTEQLKELAKEHGGTLYMTLLSLLKILLYRYTGQQDISVGSPIANRQYVETEALIGMFFNTLTMRDIIEPTDDFGIVLSKVRTTCLEAYEHQDAPFEKIVELVQPQRNLAVNPLFQVMMILQNYSVELNQNIKLYPLDSDTSNLELIVQFEENSTGLEGFIQYRTALYKASTIARMVKHFIAVCHAVIKKPDAMIKDIDYLLDEEKLQLQVEFNNTQKDYQKDSCIHSIFQRQVGLTPDAVAVEFEQQRLTYKQLFDKTQLLARYLQSIGVTPDCRVGICMNRSLEMVISIWGILQAGGAYVPLDPDYPSDRLAYMLSDSEVNIVLSQSELMGKVKACSIDNVNLIYLDERWHEIEYRSEELLSKGVEVIDEVKPENLAYLIYTSGSTGKPKGVMIEHQALMNRILWMQQSYPLNSDDLVLQKTPFSFDVSVWEFVWPLISGSRMLLARPEGHKDVSYLEKLISDYQITTLHFVPSMLTTFLANAKLTCPNVRQVFCSGEALDSQIVNSYKDKFPQAKLYNLYGPTEAAIDVTAFDCSQAEGTNISIGSPIANTQIYILDKFKQLQPVGVPGELYIAGDGLARGYLNRKELTFEKFVDNPFVKNTRMYKSGDLARWSDDGNIEYLGRLDTQVKIRGFRIETGEIEFQLNQHPGISDSCVIVMGEANNQYLAAFYVCRKINEEQSFQLETVEIKSYLQKTLPDYMIPQIYHGIDKIPLSSAGKVDRRILASTQLEFTSDSVYLAPRNLIETQLVDIWSQVLSLDGENIGIRDNFFELGGNSLLAVQLLAKINTLFSQSLPLSILFTATSIEALAEPIKNNNKQLFELLVPIQSKGQKTPIFAVPGVAGNVLSFQPFSQVLGAEQPFYGLQSVGLDGISKPLETVNEIAHHNIHRLKEVQTAGCYRLWGHSFGGVVVFEMAKLLIEQGEDISEIILLDSIAPSLIKKQTEQEQRFSVYEQCQLLANQYGVTLNLELQQLNEIPENKLGNYLSSVFLKKGIEITGEQCDAYYQVANANRKSYQNYLPKPLLKELNVHLIRATESWEKNLIPDDYGWQSLFSKPINIHNVNADHNSMLDLKCSESIVKLIS